MKGWILFLMLLSTQVARADRYSDLQSLYGKYNERINSLGEFVSNPAKAAAFTKYQEAFVTSMRKQGALKQILSVENDMDPSLWVKIYTLENEAGHLICLYWEKGHFYDEEERSFLRFRSLPQLEKGLSFIPFKNTHALLVKGFYLSSEHGGVLQFIFKKNLKLNTTTTINLNLKRTADVWKLSTDRNKVISKAHLEVWLNFLPPNGGVKSISLK